VHNTTPVITDVALQILIVFKLLWCDSKK